MEEKEFNFVYITTNLINEKQYIGDHSTDDLNCNKTKYYLGSGKYFLRALNQYKKQNFKREILEFFLSRKEAFDAQEKYIIQFNTLAPNGYNISPKGGHEVNGSVSKETIEKIKISNRLIYQNIELRKHLREKARNKPPITQETKNKIAIALTGIKQSEETKQKRSKSLKGRISPMKGRNHTDESRKKISNNPKKLLGKTLSYEITKKISKSLTGKKQSIETKQKKSLALKGKKQQIVICPHCKKMAEFV